MLESGENPVGYFAIHYTGDALNLAIPNSLRRLFRSVHRLNRRLWFQDLPEALPGAQEYALDLSEYQSWIPFYAAKSKRFRGFIDFALYANVNTDSPHFRRLGIMIPAEEHTISLVLTGFCPFQSKLELKLGDDRP